MPDVRLSPSGPTIPVELETDAVSNESVVPGDNVTEALDYLFTANQFRLFDEFLGGTSATLVASQDGGIGELGWSFVTTGGSLARPVAGDFIGAYVCTATATLTSGIRPGPNGGGSSATFPLSVVTLVEWFVTANTLQSVSGASRFGVGSDVAAAQFGTDGLFFEAAPATSPNWRVVARRASINTPITTSIPVSTTGAQVRLTLSRNSTTGAWTAFIDGVDVGSFTAGQVPIARQNGMMQVVAAAADQASIPDTFKLNYDR